MSRPTTGVLALVLCAALVLTISNGLRSSFGLFLTPMSLDIGISRETFALAIAIQGLVWGISQPVFGALADRHGAVRVILLGTVIYVAGLLWMAWADGALGLHLSQGVLVALGISATGFAVVLGPVGRAVPPEKRSMALGIAAAGGSFGQFALAPVGGALIDGVGWSVALIAYCGIAAMMVPCLVGMRGSHTPSEGSAQTLSEALVEARAHSGFWLLCGGFFVCGFHVYFIATHLPPFLTDAGLAPMMGATAIAVIGLGNIVGTFAAGWLGDRHRKKYVLSFFYLGRAAVLGMFLVVPVTEASVLVFSALMGLLWLGTVPLTSGLVAQIFGPRYLGALFGIVFFSHQLGSFLGAWLGGYVYDTTGSYDAVWMAAVALGVAAAVLHWPIRDRPLVRQEAGAA
ncbi:MAG: MFS transporter [Rhodospirillales bacterium]|nr:MFS transporter [Rhodospirillales bacterium]